MRDVSLNIQYIQYILFIVSQFLIIVRYYAFRALLLLFRFISAKFGTTEGSLRNTYEIILIECDKAQNNEFIQLTSKSIY